MGRTIVIEFAGALCLGVTLVLGALLFRARRQLRDAQLARLVLDTVPLSSFRWSAGRENPGQTASYAGFVTGLTAEDAAQLEAARLDLQTSGTPFVRAI